MRIAAILFLFVVVLSAVAAPEAGRKKAAKPKNAATAVSTGNPAKSGPAAVQTPPSKRDTAASAPDSTRRAKAADSTRNNASQRRIDSLTAAAARDTSRNTPSRDADTGSALVAGSGRAGDNTQSVRKQNTRERTATAAKNLPGAVLSGRAVLSRLPILLIIAIVAGAGAAAVVMSVRNSRDRRRFLTTTRLSVMDKEVQKACRYIEQHYADPGLSAKGVCEALVTGESFLEVLMERNLGMGLVDFITQVRVNGAKMILGRNPAASMESVAKEAGFADEALFAATFRKVTGVSFDSYTRPDGKGARPPGAEPTRES
jgi:AraC-like DNA-binding protein